MRACDNWQKGIPQTEYMKSLLRHVMDLWLLHRGLPPACDTVTDKEELLGAILFNVQGYLFEELRKAKEDPSHKGHQFFERYICGHQPPPVLVAEELP